MKVLDFKLISLFAILALTTVAALLPLYNFNVSNARHKRILDLFNYFTAGIFLGAGLLHMLPDSDAMYANTITVTPGETWCMFRVTQLVLILGWYRWEASVPRHQLLRMPWFLTHLPHR